LLKQQYVPENVVNIDQIWHFNDILRLLRDSMVKRSVETPRIVVYILAGVIYCDSKVVFLNLPKNRNKFTPKGIVKLFLYELRNQ